MRKSVDFVLSRVCVIVMGLLVIDVLWQVASRYLFTFPSSFTDELAGYLLMWTSLLGAAYATGQGEHLAIDILKRKAPAKLERVLDYLIDVVILIFALSVMVVGGSWLVYTRFLWDVTSASIGLPLGAIYSIIPISGLFIIYYAFDNILLTKNRR